VIEAAPGRPAGYGPQEGVGEEQMTRRTFSVRGVAAILRRHAHVLGRLLGRLAPRPRQTRSTRHALATRALTGHSLINLRANEAAALPSPAVVLSARLDRYYDRLRRRSGRSSTSRLSTGYRTSRSGELPQSPGRGRPPQFPPSPSERSTPSTPRSSSRLHSRICTASVAFALRDGARLSLIPPTAGTITARQASRDAADRSVAPP
jgi:hypothetical protein